MIGVNFQWFENNNIICKYESWLFYLRHELGDLSVNGGGSGYNL